MPYKPRKPCHHPGCPELVEPGKLYCEKHLPLHPEVTRSASERGYGSKWQKASRLFLQEHRYCVECLKEQPPRYEKATVVDHIAPHRGDQHLFWDKTNWQPLCKRHHDLKTGHEDALAYCYEHREEADHKKLMLDLRAILEGMRKAAF